MKMAKGRQRKTLEIMTEDVLGIARGVGRFSAYFVPGFVEHVFTPFILPTWNRRVKEKGKTKRNNPDVIRTQKMYVFRIPAEESYVEWRQIEATVNSLIWLLPFIERIKDDPKYLLVPLATNAASALYEWGRASYRMAKK